PCSNPQRSCANASPLPVPSSDTSPPPWLLALSSLPNPHGRLRGQGEELGAGGEDGPNSPAPAVAVAGLEDGADLLVHRAQQRRVVLLGKAVPETANQPVEGQLEIQRHQLAVVTGFAHDGAGGGAGPNQAADGPA